jgi:hypothetical protein
LGLNLSNSQIAKELNLVGSIATSLRKSILKNKPKLYQKYGRIHPIKIFGDNI